MLEQIIEAYEDAELQLLRVLAGYLIEDPNAVIDDTWAGKKLSNIKKLRTNAVRIINTLASLDDKAKSALLETFLTGAGSVPDDFIGTNGRALNLLVNDYIKGLRNSRFQLLRSTLDIYRSVIGIMSRKAALGIDTRITVARKVLFKFAGEGITGFVSRDGKRYDIASYVEMATRTTTLNTFREGRVLGITSRDNDLIIISSVPNPSPLCKPYERTVLSVSGKTKGYPTLAEAKGNGLFHPNCRHSFTAYLPGVTQIGKTDADKGYDNYEETQEQRYYERKVREWKRRLAVATTPEEEKKANAKIKEWRDKAKKVAQDNNLVYKPNRLSIIGAR